MKRKKKKKLTITKEQILKANRKASREAELENSTGWVATHKVHSSKKSYKRKNKRNEKY